METPRGARLEMSEVICERVVEEQEVVEETVEIEEEEVRISMTGVSMVSEVKDVAGSGVDGGGIRLEGGFKAKEDSGGGTQKKVAGVAPVLKKNVSQSGVSDGKSSRSGRSLGKGAKKQTRPSLSNSGVTALKRKRTQGDTK